MSEHKEPIPSMIYNSAVGGHVTNSQQIIDENLNREQNDINQETVGAVPYNSTTPNGMGRIVLKKNDNFKEVVEAQTNGNTIFVIKYDFTLTDDVTIPANCILEFDGGSISGAYTITGNNTGIQAGLVKIFGIEVNFKNLYHWNIKEIYPEWFGANGQDGNTYDSTAAIQKCINLAIGLKCFVTLCDTWYNATTLTIKHEMQGIRGMRNTRLGALQSNETAFIKINSGAVINYTDNLEISNLVIAPLANQIGILFEAISVNGAGAGAWHWNIKNILMYCNGAAGMYFKAVDSENNNVDVANQYIHLENVNIYKSNANVNSRCIVFEGQAGQFTMLNCEFNGYGALLSDGDNITDYIIEYIPRGSNDNAFMPQTYINCTFQSANNAVYGNFAHLVFIGCHFEGVNYASVRTNCKVYFSGNNISGGSVPFRLLAGACVDGENNTWTSPNGKFYEYEGDTLHANTRFNLYVENVGTAENVNGYSMVVTQIHTGINKEIVLKTNPTIEQIVSQIRIGDTLTIVNGSNGIVPIKTKKGISLSNILSNKYEIIYLEPNSSIVLLRTPNGFYINSINKVIPYSYSNGNLTLFDNDYITITDPLGGDVLLMTTDSLSPYIVIKNKTGANIAFSTRNNSADGNIVYHTRNYFILQDGKMAVFLRSPYDGYFHVLNPEMVCNDYSISDYTITNQLNFQLMPIGYPIYNNDKKVIRWWNGTALVNSNGNTDDEITNGKKVNLVNNVISSTYIESGLYYVDDDTSGDVLAINISVPAGMQFTIMNKRATAYFMLYTKDGSGSSNVIYPGHKWMRVEPGDTVTLIKQDNGDFRYISSSKIYHLENADYLSGIRIGENLYNDVKKHPTWWNGSDWIDGSGSTDNERENGYSLSLTNSILKSNSVIGKLFYIEEGTDDVLILNMAVPIGTEFTIVNKRESAHFMLYSKDGSPSSNVLIPGSKWVRIDVGENITLVKEDTDLYRYIRSSRTPILDNPSYITGARVGDMSFDYTNKKPVWFDGTQWVYADGTAVS